MLGNLMLLASMRQSKVDEEPIASVQRQAWVESTRANSEDVSFRDPFLPSQRSAVVKPVLIGDLSLTPKRTKSCQSKSQN